MLAHSHEPEPLAENGDSADERDERRSHFSPEPRPRATPSEFRLSDCTNNHSTIKIVLQC